MKELLISICLLTGMFMNITPAFAKGNYSNVYDVNSGDTLWKISKKYGSSADELRVANGLQSDVLTVGQKLWVPMTYTAASGDTIWKIASAYNSTVQDIKTANSLSSDALLVGQKLKVPPKKLPVQGQYILMTRDEFKYWLFHHSFSRKIIRIQEHHTYQPSYKQFNGSNHFSLLKGMETFHVHQMGWSTISQNLTTFPDGRIAVCRPINIAPQGSFAFKNPALAKKIESGSLTIENLGNFDIGGDAMTNEQKETIAYVAALLCLKFGLTPSIDSITYHHWWDMNTGERVLDYSAGHSVKTCPGTAFFGGNSTLSAKTNFYPLVSQKMQQIRASM